MDLRRIFAAALLTCVAVSVGIVPADAQRRTWGAWTLSDDGLGVPNVPDRRGCVRMCEQDTAPCDLPTYKHADGRCTSDY